MLTEALLVCFGLAAVGSAAGAGFAYLRGLKRCPESWRVAAEACELTDVQVREHLMRSPVLEGRSGKLRVRFQRYSEGTRVLIDDLPLGHDLSLGLGGAGKLELGDPAFDVMVRAEGSPTFLRAFFDAETRRRARQLLVVGDWVAVSNGLLRMDVPWPLVRDPRAEGGYRRAPHEALEVLGATLERLLVFARRLFRYDVVQRLAHNARSDPDVKVRLNNLLTLVREYAERSEARETFRAALGDPHPEIQLQAAIALGDEARDFLLGVACGAWGDPSSARALTALGKGLPRERIQPILEQALRSRRIETARACVTLLGLHGDDQAIEALGKVLLVERSELAAEAARVLRATGQAIAQAPLCEALTRNDAELRVASAEALGRVGTIEAVPALKEAVARHPEDKELNRVARQAIAEIQSRLTGASPGQLSLAEGDVGQLSLAEGGAGGLSLAEAAVGQSPAAKGQR